MTDMDSMSVITMKDIEFISAKNCLSCNKMRDILRETLVKTGVYATIHEIDSETSEAIEVAIEEGIEDIPACVIGDEVFYGKNGFTYDGILNAMKKLGE